jgi:hypothetical protein
LLYEPFGHFSIDVYVWVHDIQLLTNVIDASKFLPDRVKQDDLGRIPAQYQYRWYACKAYPRSNWNNPNIPILSFFPRR